jgi:hypothetical protein
VLSQCAFTLSGTATPGCTQFLPPREDKSFKPSRRAACPLTSIAWIVFSRIKRYASIRAESNFMNFQSLSEADRTIVGQALLAAADGPFFPDWEFHTLFGLERSRVRAIATAWPELSAPLDEVALAVNNSLNNLLGYPHDQNAVWSHWISVDRKQLGDLFNKLRDHGDESYFERMK